MRVALQLPDGDGIAVEVPGDLDLSTIGPFEGSLVEDGTMVLRYTGVLSLTEDDPSLPDKLCGEILIPYRTREGSAAIYRVGLPAPDPFTGSDLQSMWDGVGALGLDLEGALALQGTFETPSSFRPLGIAPKDSSALVRLIANGQQLLAAWPQEGTAVDVWRPAQVSGGIENPVLTVRRGLQARWGHANGTPYPERSARRAISADDWRLAGVSRLAAQVADDLRGAESPFVSLFSQVALRAAPRDPRQVDPAPSSWPHALLEFSQLAWRFLHQARLGEHNGSSGPVRLCRVWELYERWVAAETLRCVERILGTPPRICLGSGLHDFDWRAEWITSDMTIHVDSKHAFTDTAESGDWHAGYRSVTAKLTPDALVALDSGKGKSALLLIDAKERGATFGRDAAAASAAKYLWGLRDKAGFISDGVSVLLATSRNISQSVFDEKLARMKFVRTVPSDSDNLLTAIGEFIGRYRGPGT